MAVLCDSAHRKIAWTRQAINYDIITNITFFYKNIDTQETFLTILLV